jgi:hypothetical protein
MTRSPSATATTRRRHLAFTRPVIAAFIHVCKAGQLDDLAG